MPRHAPQRPCMVHDFTLNTLAVQKLPVGLPVSLRKQARSTRRRYWNPSPRAWPCRPCTRWLIPAMLAILSFLLTTNLSDSLFGDVFGALQALACTAGCLALPTPRDAFLTALEKVALPPCAVAVAVTTTRTAGAALLRLTGGAHARPRRQQGGKQM